MTTLSENELNSRTVCSWMPVAPVDERMGPAVGTLDWALQERYDGVVPSMASIRARFVHLWQEHWGDRPKTGDYWKGPRLAVTLGTKLYKLLLHYGCLKPYGPYTLNLTYGLELNEGRIEGYSAILERPKNKDRPKTYPQFVFALDIRDIQPRILYVPDYRGFARWLSMQTQWEASDIGMMHLPMLRGGSWFETRLDRVLVEEWLGSIMKQAAELPTYPTAGLHCRSCPAPCMEVFLGSNDYYRKRRLTKISGA